MIKWGAITGIPWLFRDVLAKKDLPCTRIRQDIEKRSHFYRLWNTQRSRTVCDARSSFDRHMTMRTVHSRQSFITGKWWGEFFRFISAPPFARLGKYVHLQHFWMAILLIIEENYRCTEMNAHAINVALDAEYESFPSAVCRTSFLPFLRFFYLLYLFALRKHNTVQLFLLHCNTCLAFHFSLRTIWLMSSASCAFSFATLDLLSQLRTHHLYHICIHYYV